MEDSEAEPRQSGRVEGHCALWSLYMEESLPLFINQIQSPGQDDLFLKWWVEDFASPFRVKACNAQVTLVFPHAFTGEDSSRSPAGRVCHHTPSASTEFLQ